MHILLALSILMVQSAPAPKNPPVSRYCRLLNDKSAFASFLRHLESELLRMAHEQPKKFGRLDMHPTDGEPAGLPSTEWTLVAPRASHVAHSGPWRDAAQLGKVLRVSRQQYVAAWYGLA